MSRVVTRPAPYTLACHQHGTRFPYINYYLRSSPMRRHGNQLVRPSTKESRKTSIGLTFKETCKQNEAERKNFVFTRILNNLCRHSIVLFSFPSLSSLLTYARPFSTADPTWWRGRWQSQWGPWKGPMGSRWWRWQRRGGSSSWGPWPWRKSAICSMLGITLF